MQQRAILIFLQNNAGSTVWAFWISGNHTNVRNKMPVKLAKILGDLNGVEKKQKSLIEFQPTKTQMLFSTNGKTEFVIQADWK